jgi:hypothetical protein
MFETPRSGTGPKDVFFHLLAIGTLYVCVINILVLLFQYINHLFPDTLNYWNGADLGAIRFADAALIIVFPVLLLVSWLIHRDMRREPGKANVWVRKWLLYLTLLLASITIITDLVILVFSFLNGDLTAPFLLKVLAVLVVAAAVFGYYVWELRQKDFSQSNTPRTTAWVSALVVAASVIAGFFIIGSPFYQRSVRLDERRVSDLQQLYDAVTNYWSLKRVLPSSIQTLKEISATTPLTDPDTGKPYEYRVVSSRSFELCATFAVATPKADSTSRYGSPYQQDWTHEAGRKCFTRTIDPDLFPKPVPAYKY